MKYCPNCGAPIEDNHKFCANCGHKLEAPEAVELPPEPVYTDDPALVNDPVLAPSPAPAPKPKAEKVPELTLEPDLWGLGAAATAAATCATFSSWTMKISFSPASFAATSARASPRIMTTSLLIVRKDSEKSAISSLANDLLQIGVVLVKRSVTHPVNFKLVGIERLFNGQRIGFHRPVVGVPEIEPVFALEAGNAGL